MFLGAIRVLSSEKGEKNRKFNFFQKKSQIMLGTRDY